MNIQKELEKDGIQIVEKLDSIISNDICKSVSRRIYETFPDYDLTENDIFCKLKKINMYMAKMEEGMAEAKYFYKNTSIYFNDKIALDDLEEFAIHECIHYLQEVKDSNNNLLRMGLHNFEFSKSSGLAFNEAAVQYMASHIIGVEPSFEKYYGISLYTPSPSYYPLECSLLNEITYFTGTDILFKSTLFANDNFKNTVTNMTSAEIYIKLEKILDDILNTEENIIKLNNKKFLYEDGDSRIDKICLKIDNLKSKIAKKYIEAQTIIIKNFFDCEFSRISNLEELENFRHKLCNFSNISASIQDYHFFDDYYNEMMNKLELKCSRLENGEIETALIPKKQNSFINFIKKILKFVLKNKLKTENE